MTPEEIRAVLEDDALSPYQAKAYVALLDLRDASVPELVEACPVPQPRIYDVLRSLDEKGFVETYEEETLRARVTDPSAVVEDLQTKADQYARAAEGIDDLWERPPLGEHDIEVFSAFADVTEHAAAAVEEATASVNLAIRGSTYLELRRPLRAAKERGVVVNVSLYLEGDSRTELSDMDAFFAETATEVRHRHSHAPFLAIVDAGESYFGVPRSTSGYGIAIQDHELSAMLCGHFEDSLWNHWEQVHSDRPSGFPKVFTSIRNCVAEIAPRAAEADDLRATVEGFDTETGEETRVDGRIDDVIPAPSADNGPHEADQVTLFLDDGDAVHSVGGFGAVIEDVRVAWIRVEDADDD
ncbi:TrmB family transcriptional regulator sugar-binding domain-containing protein [Halosimplex marinum]|uniref:TrmB family transcriptional regulator sugar-binding domain-containing protein n=1 Tax=Halosimplex marinum TaxID=3396620 RepID=UPI003F54F840